MAVTFDSTQLAQLGDDYTFYRYVDENGEALTGQFFAIPVEQEPVQQGELFVFVAVVKILNQGNSAVRTATLDSDFINKSIQVRGANAALTVSKTHPALITHLLKAAA